ncbi:MAG: hypothetical protein EON90_05355 [Brevundimonas sp.]|nr:MAG: hypothetical protein EON90_05355 [Brevundimonas sp.]
MSTLVILSPSTLTPEPARFSDLTRDVVREAGATWEMDDGDWFLRLHDGSDVVFEFLRDENSAYLELDHAIEPAIDLVWEIAERTNAFVSIMTLGRGGFPSGGEVPTCAPPSAGAILAENVGGHALPTPVEDRRHFGEWCGVVYRDIARIRALADRPQRSLLQKISDAIFGLHASTPPLAPVNATRRRENEGRAARLGGHSEMMRGETPILREPS